MDTALTFTQSTLVIAGTTYQFQVRAHNIHGWGEFSNPISIVAATFPDQPSAPTTSLNNIFVRIDWTSPDSNSGTINGYRVYIADSNGNFLLETTYCNGLIEPVLSQTYCDMPMTVLRAAPYLLEQGEEVFTKV